VLLSPVIEGDMDGNGVVNRADTALFATNYGRSGDVGYDDGDFNGDGLVGLADVVVLQRNFTREFSAVESRPVAEPSSFWLAAMLLGALAMMRGLRNRPVLNPVQTISRSGLFRSARGRR
jgi:hypothetical protein